MSIMQMEMVSVDSLVALKHPYRRMKDSLDFERLVLGVSLDRSGLGRTGFSVDRLVMCLVLQFMENLSDREFERFMQENNAARWFCGFALTEKTPDFTTVCKFRNLLGTDEIDRLFKNVNIQLKEKGCITEIFTFIDATALTSKLEMWEERDKAISEGYEKFNNEIIGKYAKDPEVRFGSKGKTKFWLGYKKHISVDMQSGMINRVNVTQANVPDHDGTAVAAVLPSQGAVTGDKGFVGAIELIRAFGLHPMILLRNDMKEKNRDKDRFISKLRAPYEGVFSKQQKRVRYKGVAKNHAAECLYAIAHNLRRLLALEIANAKC